MTLSRPKVCLQVCSVRPERVVYRTLLLAQVGTYIACHP